MANSTTVAFVLADVDSEEPGPCRDAVVWLDAEAVTSSAPLRGSSEPVARLNVETVAALDLATARQ